MAPAPADAVAATVSGSSLQAEYGQALDRESAYERLQAKLAPAPAPARAPAQAKAPSGGAARGREREQPNVVEQVVSSPVVKSFLRSAGTVLGREITRSLFGTATKRRR
jgi:hypothetical protein